MIKVNKEECQKIDDNQVETIIYAVLLGCRQRLTNKCKRRPYRKQKNIRIKFRKVKSELDPGYLGFGIFKIEFKDLFLFIIHSNP